MSRRVPPTEKCPTTGKYMHRSRAAAMKVVKKTRVAESSARTVYECPHCVHPATGQPGWHLTKQRRKKRPRAGASRA